MEWDCLLWEAQVEEAKNEVRISIEADCTGIDDDWIKRFQEQGVEVSSIKIRPEGAAPRQRRSF